MSLVLEMKASFYMKVIKKCKKRKLTIATVDVSIDQAWQIDAQLYQKQLEQFVG